MADLMEDIDLRSTAEIARRGTADPLDEAALHAARPATIEIPASHVSKAKVAKYCARSSTASRRRRLVSSCSSPLCLPRSCAACSCRASPSAHSCCASALPECADLKCTTADGRSWAVVR